MSALPNLITVLRILLVAPLVWLLSQGRYREAMVIFIVAGLSDALDGLLARHYGWTSRFGAALDPQDDPIASAWYRGAVAPVHLRRLLLGEE